MKYIREEIISNLYETSKSASGTALLTSDAEKFSVYNLDAVKEIFCKEYRYGEKIKSCDAYYCDNYNYVVVEFKNTHHMKLKCFYNEIEMKLTDTHMLLCESFWKNKKGTEIGKKVKVLVVYNDTMNYEKGVLNIGKALNKMAPKQGNTQRNSKMPEIFENETEFNHTITETSKKYQKEFYKEIEFLEKKQFEHSYINTGYFGQLVEYTEWYC